MREGPSRVASRHGLPGPGLRRAAPGVLRRRVADDDPVDRRHREAHGAVEEKDRPPALAVEPADRAGEGGLHRQAVEPCDLRRRALAGGLRARADASRGRTPGANGTPSVSDGSVKARFIPAASRLGGVVRGARGRPRPGPEDAAGELGRGGPFGRGQLAAQRLGVEDVPGREPRRARPGDEPDDQQGRQERRGRAAETSAQRDQAARHAPPRGRHPAAQKAPTPSGTPRPGPVRRRAVPRSDRPGLTPRPSTR